MSNLIESAKRSIDRLLSEACQRAAEAGQLPAGAALTGTVEIPKDTRNGDYAANHAMAGAKALHMAPRKIAELLVSNLELSGSWFSSVEVAGPGFINFRLVFTLHSTLHTPSSFTYFRGLLFSAWKVRFSLCLLPTGKGKFLLA